MHSLPVAELAWPQQVSNFRNVVSIAISEWENKLSDSKRSCHFAKLAPGQKFRLVTRRDRAGQISCDRENLFLFRQQSCSLCILIATITFWSRETPCITRTRCFEKNLPLIVFFYAKFCTLLSKQCCISLPLKLKYIQNCQFYVSFYAGLKWLAEILNLELK